MSRWNELVVQAKWDHLRSGRKPSMPVHIRYTLYAFFPLLNIYPLEADNRTCRAELEGALWITEL